MKHRSKVSKRDSFAVTDDLAWASDSFSSVNSGYSGYGSERSYVQPKIEKLCDDDESWFSEAESDFSDFDCLPAAKSERTKKFLWRRKIVKPADACASETIVATERPSKMMFPDVADFSPELVSKAETTVNNSSKSKTRRHRQVEKDSGLKKSPAKTSQFGDTIAFVANDLSEHKAEIEKNGTQKTNNEKDERRRKRREARAKAKVEAAWGSETESELVDTVQKIKTIKRREMTVASGEPALAIEGSVGTKTKKQRKKSVLSGCDDFTGDCGSETDSSFSPIKKGRKEKCKLRSFSTEYKTSVDQRIQGSRRSMSPSDLLRRQGSRKSSLRSVLQEKSGNERKSRHDGRDLLAQSESSDDEGRKCTSKLSVAAKIGVFEGRSRKSRHSPSDLVKSASKQHLSRGEGKRSVASSDIEKDMERRQTDDEGDRRRSNSKSQKGASKERSNLLHQDKTEATEDEHESELDLSSRKGIVKKSKNFTMVRSDSIRRMQRGKTSCLTTDAENDLPRGGLRSTMQCATEWEKNASSEKEGYKRGQCLVVQLSARNLLADPERARRNEREEASKQWRDKEKFKAKNYSDFDDLFDQKADDSKDEQHQTILDQSRRGPDKAQSHRIISSDSMERSNSARGHDKLLLEDENKSARQKGHRSCQRDRQSSALDRGGGDDNLLPAIFQRGSSYLPSALGQRDSAFGGLDGSGRIPRNSSLKDLLINVEGSFLPPTSASVPDRLWKKNVEVAESSASVPGDARAGNVAKQRSASATRNHSRNFDSTVDDLLKTRRLRGFDSTSRPRSRREKDSPDKKTKTTRDALAVISSSLHGMIKL
jgi:plastocyanin